ncbi:MAG: ribonuclease Y [Candidatus Liptonbacteria bacterium]|nr:ribonuclease Y [Candidatus Liptonbacteria bacterium]
MENSFPTLFAVGLFLGLVIGYFGRRAWVSRQASSIEEKVKSRLEEAEKKSKSVLLEAEDKASSILAEAKKEEKEAKVQLEGLQDRLLRREETLDKKLSALTADEARLREKSEELKKKEEDLKEIRREAEARLEKISGLTKEAAREELFSQLKEDWSGDLAALLQKMSKERLEETEKKGLEIITMSLERYARSHVSEITTSVFHLSDEELKGKIIGREGRNIRALERATGVELVIDETPDSIAISSFDPYRREVARMALEKLIKDGRIQPAKIEEKVEEAKTELNKRILEIGEGAANDVGIYDLPKEILQLLGRLHFRTSYGQNVLTHSIEMAYLSQMMAGELGLKVEVAKKGALLHDIGKAIDHEVEGTHVELGRKILKKYGLPEEVIQAMQSHHSDYPYATPEAYVVTAADVLSAARPGARRDTLEHYIKRLGDLEKIAEGFPGVRQAYAISAGRELRVFVIPEKVDDFRALELAREIANRIQSEVKYPGEIKVNVIREVRAVEYAR